MKCFISISSYLSISAISYEIYISFGPRVQNPKKWLAPKLQGPDVFHAASLYFWSLTSNHEYAMGVEYWQLNVCPQLERGWQSHNSPVSTHTPVQILYLMTSCCLNDKGKPTIQTLPMPVSVYSSVCYHSLSIHVSLLALQASQWTVSQGRQMVHWLWPFWCFQARSMPSHQWNNLLIFKPCFTRRRGIIWSQP